MDRMESRLERQNATLDQVLMLLAPHTSLLGDAPRKLAFSANPASPPYHKLSLP